MADVEDNCYTPPEWISENEVKSSGKNNFHPFSSLSFSEIVFKAWRIERKYEWGVNALSPYRDANLTQSIGTQTINIFEIPNVLVW